MSTNGETLIIQITDPSHPDRQCAFWGVRWTADPEFVTYHNGSYRERLHVSQFRQITEQEAEPTTCDCGSADCPVCCYNQPRPEFDEGAWVIECLNKYGQFPADLVLLCRDCSQEVCCCWEDDEPDPNAVELNQDARDRLTEQDGVQFDAHGMVVTDDTPRRWEQPGAESE